MRNSIKYAVLNIGMLLLGVALLAFAGAVVEGGVSLLLGMAVCCTLAVAMRLAWREIGRMERFAKQEKRAHRHASAPVCEGPDLRVA